MNPRRVVLDRSVVVAGLRTRLGASNRLLELVAEQRVIPLVTTALFLEYEEVLKRPEQRLATGMSEADVMGFLAAFASAAEPVDVHFLWRPLLADPDDELVLECAARNRMSSGSLVPVARRCSGRFRTSSYSRNSAVVTRGITRRSATNSSNLLLAPSRLCSPATTTELSRTTRRVIICHTLCDVTSFGKSNNG